MKLIKIADRVINLEQVTEIVLNYSHPDDREHTVTRIFFALQIGDGEGPDYTDLVGRSRKAFLSWLDQNSEDLTWMMSLNTD